MREKSYTISAAKNGYVLNVGWYGKEDDRYQSETHIFADWTEIVEWLKRNKIEA